MVQEYLVTAKYFVWGGEAAWSEVCGEVRVVDGAS